VGGGWWVVGGGWWVWVVGVWALRPVVFHSYVEVLHGCV
jgi:hypothetical protein